MIAEVPEKTIRTAVENLFLKEMTVDDIIETAVDTMESMVLDMLCEAPSPTSLFD